MYLPFAANGIASLLGSLRCFLVFSGVVLVPDSDAIRFICGEVLVEFDDDDDDGVCAGLFGLGILVVGEDLVGGSFDRLVLNKGAILTG